MKTSKIIIVCLFCLSNLKGFSQKTPSVEKSIFAIETGLLGIWINNESRLSENFTLRSELGLDAGIFGGGIQNKSGFILTPVVTLEPRYYYNLEKRFNNAKKIKNNSANFITLSVKYQPDLFVISNDDNINVISNISFIPKWGIRRSLSDHFYFETGIGFGYRYFLEKVENEKGEGALDLHLRIGYNF
jgi:hypothetical protein